MRLRKSRINLEGFRRGVFRQRENILRRPNALAAQKAVAVGESGVSKRVVSIFFNRLPEIINRLLIALFRSLVSIETTLQIKLIRLRIGSVTLGGELLLRVGESLLQLVQHIPGDLALHGN